MTPLMRRFALSSLAAAALLAATPALADAWGTYTNVRFGYSICYPEHLLTPQPEADNSDGRVFEGRAGASLRVWGSMNAGEYTVKQIVDDIAGSDKVTYRKVSKGWAVVSGHGKDGVFYARILFQTNREGEVTSTSNFYLVYPDNQAGVYEPVATRLSRCFTGPTGE